MANENFVQQRRFSGLDLFHAPQDLAADKVTQSDNCVNYGGELWTRPGLQGVFTSLLGGPIYAATEFVRLDGTTVILFVSGGKLYFTVKQTAPMTWTEILLPASTSFALTSASARIYVEGKYAYVVDANASHTLYRVNVNADNTYSAATVTALTAPTAPSAVALTNTSQDGTTDYTKWAGMGHVAGPTSNLLTNAGFESNGGQSTNPTSWTAFGGVPNVAGAGSGANNGSGIIVPAEGTYALQLDYAGSGYYQDVTPPKYTSAPSGSTQPTARVYYFGGYFRSFSLTGTNSIDVDLIALDGSNNFLKLVRTTIMPPCDRTVGGWVFYEFTASFTDLTVDPTKIRCRLTASGTVVTSFFGAIWADYLTLVPVDVFLTVATQTSSSLTVSLGASSNNLPTLTASTPPSQVLQSHGLACVGQQWVRRDYSATGTVYTDLVIDAADLTKVTSAGHPFSSADVNKTLNITSGTNFTVSNPYIVSVSGVVATLSAAAGTTLGATGGHATAVATANYAGANNYAMAFSAPPAVTAAGLVGKWALGFQLYGDGTNTIVYSNFNQVDTTSSYLTFDVSSVPAATRAQSKYVYLTLVADLPPGDFSNLYTFGPITQAGNLTIGSGDYVYVITEAQDTRYDTTGTSTGITTDGIVESNCSPPTTILTPTGVKDQASMSLPPKLNAAANYYNVYRLGGPFSATDPIATYRLIGRLPMWQSTLDSSSPGFGYITWDSTARKFTDNTPDGALQALVPTLASGHDAAPNGCTCVTGWRGRVVLAKAATLYVSDLMNTDAAAALYYPAINVPGDPAGATKGWTVPVSPNDGDTVQQIVASGQYLVIFKGRSLSVMTGTNPYDYVLTQHLKLAGVGLVAPQGVALVEESPWFVGQNAVWSYEGGESPTKQSLEIEPALAPQTQGGASIPSSAKLGSVADYHAQRFYLACPGTAASTGNDTIYVYDTRLDLQGAPAGWTKFISLPEAITSICSMSAAAETEDLFFGSAGGQLYQHTGSGDCATVKAVTSASNATPVVIGVTAHGASNGQAVIVRGVGGNTAANGSVLYAGSVTTNTLALYSDAALSVPVAGNGSYTSSTGCFAKLSAVTFTVKTRGMAQEQGGQTWFQTNRPTRVLAKLTTQEAVAAMTLTCAAASDAVTSAVTHSVPSGVIQFRDKVNAAVRGDAISVSISGASVLPTKVTSLAVEAAEGSIRGNA